MTPDLRRLQEYLRTALNLEVRPRSWHRADQLPHFLRERYTFAHADLLGTPCLFVIDASREEESPGAIRKHLDMLRPKSDGEVIYVRDQVMAFNRKRLIEQNVPFIVPGNQMYLPMLGIDLREHFRRTRRESPKFSPATQAVVIYALLNDRSDGLVPLEMAERLGYSQMTMTRAFDELDAAGFGTAITRGRERHLSFQKRHRELWEKSQPYLRSPVAKRAHVQSLKPLKGVRAGLSALAHYSMLSPPPRVTLAFDREQWKQYREEHRPHLVPAGDHDSHEIQVWSYSPDLFARGGTVDPLSLYLSLKNDKDERIESSLEEMLRTQGW